MKETSSKVLETPNARFTKDAGRCTVMIPEIGELSAPTHLWHEVARFNEKPALVEQAAWMSGDPRLDADFFRAFRKEVLAGYVASRLDSVKGSN